MVANLLVVVVVVVAGVVALVGELFVDDTEAAPFPSILAIPLAKLRLLLLLPAAALLLVTLLLLPPLLPRRCSTRRSACNFTSFNSFNLFTLPLLNGGGSNRLAARCLASLILSSALPLLFRFSLRCLGRWRWLRIEREDVLEVLEMVVMLSLSSLVSLVGE